MYACFLASPGDVAEERKLARAVIDKLRNEFRYKERISFETVAWDQPGAGVVQEAALTPQAAIAKGLPTPSECDLVIVLFWSRMGTPLPIEYSKSDGSRYLSGTEWEFCNAIDGSAQWLPIRFKPAEIDNNPFMALAAQLTPLLEKQGWRAGDLATQLAEMPSLLAERLSDQIRGAHANTGDLLLVIDQFEELFTRCDAKYLPPFIDLITLTNQAAHLRVLITMRADYFRNCVDWPKLTALLNQGAYSLPAPGVAALLEMIQAPARLAGVALEDRLADQMLQDIGEAPGRLALVAFALEKLYEADRAKRCLTHASYQGFGGVRGAIAQKADETYLGLQHQGVAVETALGQLFRELATIDPERNVATRKRTPVSRFMGDALRLKNALVEARLLVSDKGVIEVAHEVLFESWPRLKAWIDTVGGDLRLLARAKAEARTWADAGQDTHHLWSHERLEPVYEMFDRLGLHRQTLDEPLKSFVRPEVERLLEELEQLDTSHYRRAAIGDRLNQIGDPREGVGVNVAGVPQIKWIPVPPGQIRLEDNANSRDIAPFYIAKYPVTYRQYRAF